MKKMMNTTKAIGLATIVLINSEAFAKKREPVSQQQQGVCICQTNQQPGSSANSPNSSAILKLVLVGNFYNTNPWSGSTTPTQISASTIAYFTSSYDDKGLAEVKSQCNQQAELLRASGMCK